MPAGRWSKALGRTAIPPRSVAITNCDSKNNRKSSRISVGRPRSGCVNASAIAAHAANTPTSSRWPVPVSWQASCGRLPRRSRSHPKAKIAHDSTTNSNGLPTCIGRDAAPVWCHPRQREEASRGHSSLDRGRHPTEARQVGATPRIAAGSPVGASGLRLFRCPEDNSIMRT
jgi:hypothetical protein